MNTRMTIACGVLLLLCGVLGAEARPVGVWFELNASVAAMSAGDFTTVNSPAAVFASEFNAAIGGIDYAKGVQGAMGCESSSGLGGFIRSGYAWGSAELTSVATDENGQVLGDLVTQYRLATIPVEVGAYNRIVRGNTAWLVEGAVEVNFVDFTERPQNFKDMGFDIHSLADATMLGAHAALAAEWMPTPAFALGLRGGYRVTEDVRLTTFVANLGGPFVNVYTTYRPWGND